LIQYNNRHSELLKNIGHLQDEMKEDKVVEKKLKTDHDFGYVKSNTGANVKQQAAKMAGRRPDQSRNKYQSIRSFAQKYRLGSKKIKNINTSLLKILDRFEMDRPQLVREKIKILMERGDEEFDDELKQSPL